MFWSPHLHVLKHWEPLLYYELLYNISKVRLWTHCINNLWSGLRQRSSSRTICSAETCKTIVWDHQKNEMQALPCITLSFYLSCVSFEGFSDGQCSSIGFSAVFSAQQKPQKSAGATSAAVGGGLCRHGDGWGSDAGANRENFSMRMKEWKKVVFSFLKKGGKEMVTQGTIKEEAYPHTEGHQKHRPPEMKRDRY